MNTPDAFAISTFSDYVVQFADDHQHPNRVRVVWPCEGQTEDECDAARGNWPSPPAGWSPARYLNGDIGVCDAGLFVDYDPDAEDAPLQCVHDGYDPDGRIPYASVEAFLDMCVTCFGEAPELRHINGAWVNESNEAVLRPVRA